MTRSTIQAALRRPGRGRAHAAYRTATAELGLLPPCGASVRPLASQRELASQRQQAAQLRA